MSKKTLLIAFLLISIISHGQKKDTVIVNLANTSQVIFTIEDKNDLDILKQYDFQDLFQDIIAKIEANDTTRLTGDESSEKTEEENWDNSDDDEDLWALRENEADHRDYNDNDNNDNTDWDFDWKRNSWGRTSQSFNFDLGTNNYLSDGKFPEGDENYAVRPWGSWYVGINSIQRSRMGKKLFLEWGVGISWYNFKFQKDNILIEKTDNGTVFIEDDRDASFRKSKLTASYINAFLVPVFDFGDNSYRPRFWDGHSNAFRFGMGPYAGYRIGSHSKIVYKDDGRQKDKDRDNFNLQNFRYGVRMQIGFRSTDFFFNYDLNELFADQQSPSLNAFSFGVVF